MVVVTWSIFRHCGPRRIFGREKDGCGRWGCPAPGQRGVTARSSFAPSGPWGRTELTLIGRGRDAAAAAAEDDADSRHGQGGASDDRDRPTEPCRRRYRRHLLLRRRRLPARRSRPTAAR